MDIPGEDKRPWKVPIRWQILQAAKSRHKTLDEYIAGDWTRWVHIHEEIAFDELQARQEDVVSRGDDTVQQSTSPKKFVKSNE